MKQNQTTEKIGQAPLPAARSGSRATNRSRISRLGGAVAVLLLAAGSAWAQTTNVINEYNNTGTTVSGTVNSVTLQSLTANVARFSVPVNAEGSLASAVNVNLGAAQTVYLSSVTNDTDPMNIYITNYYDLNPAVVTVAAADMPGSGAEVILGSAAAGTNATITLTNATAGNSTMAVDVTLNYTNVPSGEYAMVVQAAGANTWRYPLPVRAGFTWSGGGGADTNFTTTANWIGGALPGVSDIVTLDVAGAVASATQPTIAIAADTTIGSINDIHAGDNYTHWNIAEGATLSVLGDGGFRQLVDLIDTAQRSRIRASGAGTLLVSNVNAEVNFFTTRQNNSHDSADFSALNTLVMDVKSISFNDIAAYPNIRTNGNVNRPYRNVYDMDWALTNILRATQTDANNWTNLTRNYSMVINRENVSGQTGSDGGMHFGLWNELYMDSILFGGYSQMENPQVDFRAAGGSYLLLRGPDKVSRLSNLTIADAGDALQTGSANSGGTKVNVNFNKGVVDALVDTLIIARNPRFTANGPATGKLYLGAAVGDTTFDVNNAYLGYQTGACDGTESGAAQGQLYVQSNTVFRVNGNLVLGYTETNTSTVVGGYGQLNVSTASGVAQINNITVGGPANASTGGNNVTVGSGSTLVVSNGMGSLSAPVNNLSLAGTLVLPNLTSTTQTNVYAANISGSGGIISLPGITAGGTYIVAKYTSSALPTWTLDLPSGYYGFLTVDAGDQTIKAVISSTPPKTCVWVGYPGTDWDTTSLNWKELVTGYPTNFNQGDAVLFDDSASNSIVNVAMTVIPAGGTIITNDTLDYTFSGSNIEGTAGTVKSGTGTVTYNNTHLPSLTVDTNGLLVVNGSLNGGVTFRGASAINNGTILGSVSLLNSNAVLVNNGTITTTPGALTLVAGTILTNSPSGTINNGSSANTTTPLGSLVVNQGQINNISKRIEVNGVWISDGGIVTDLGATTEALLAAGNGRFGIQATGELYIRGAGDINYMQVEARFDNQPGSKIYIDVDRAASPNCDHIKVDYFGDMRGNFVMNNIGATPFANGDSFTVMRQTYDIPKTNANPVQVSLVLPRAAGVGLAWDTSGLQSTATTPAPSAVRTIAVAPVLTSPAPEMTSVSSGGNLVVNWATNYWGYQLQVQTNSLSTGISNNWVAVPSSEYTNVWTVPLNSTDESVFYRLSNQ